MAKRIGQWKPEDSGSRRRQTPPQPRRDPAPVLPHRDAPSRQDHRPEPEVRYVYVDRRPFNSEGVVGLVFSLLWIFGLGSLLGLIAGISCVRKCQREDMSGEWAGHLSWILGLMGLFATVVAVLSAIAGA